MYTHMSILRPICPTVHGYGDSAKRRTARGGGETRQNVCMPPATVDPALATVIRRLRKERGVSQQTIASRAGITTGSYAKVENGLSNATWSSVRAIAAAFDVSIGELARAVEDVERSAKRKRRA
jgi:DNA-binding XRE family transcriptional regulator